MRLAALAPATALGIAASANATPSAPNLPAQRNATVVQAEWGCGWGFHPNPWGRCVPNGWGYWHRPHGWWWRHHGYYGGGYYPYWRHRYWYGY
jgi:hypothetical protein